jgi:hypothetical protein
MPQAHLNTTPNNVRQCDPYIPKQICRNPDELYDDFYNVTGHVLDVIYDTSRYFSILAFKPGLSAVKTQYLSQRCVVETLYLSITTNLTLRVAPRINE